jgi:hypothetical protein
MRFPTTKRPPGWNNRAGCVLSFSGFGFPEEVFEPLKECGWVSGGDGYREGVKSTGNVSVRHCWGWWSW